MCHAELTLFALRSSCSFGERVAAALGISLAPHEEQDFADGEHATRPLESVRDRDVFVVQSLYADGSQSVNDKLCRLLFFVGALKDASAARVTVVVPYLCYSREDRRVRPREPVTTRYVAGLFEAAGVDRLLALDIHDLAAFQNAFQIPTDHLTSVPLFVRHCVSSLPHNELTVVSPDAGGIKRAEQFREALAEAVGRPVEGAFLTKRRVDGVVTAEGMLVGPVAGRRAVIFDDMIATGETLRRAVRACRDSGASHVYAAATHGLFAGDAGSVVADPALDRVFVTDTVPPFRLDPQVARERLAVLEAAGLFAEAICRLHAGRSLADLTGG